MTALEAECAFPRARLGITHNGEWQLVLVPIPGADEMDSFDVWRGAKGERQLNGRSRHFLGGGDCYWVSIAVVVLLQTSKG